ncbi:hypothetical protein CPC08DRAFT_721228 [Agrocybe pediades]|nr:hypothetical protein CPC08DRAFT_721228 [Agrocybe pediades]
MQLTIAFATMLMSGVLPALAAPAGAEAVDCRSRTAREARPQHPRLPECCYPFSALGLSGYQSFGPDQGTTCLWYTGAGCTGTQSDAVQYPGYGVVPGFWQSNTQSFKCWT